MLSSRHRGDRSPPVRQAARLLRDHFPARELPRSRQRAGRRPTNARRCTRRRCSQGTTCSRIAEVHRLTLRLWRQRWTIRARRTAAWQGPNNLVAHALSMCSRKHSLPARAIRNGTVAGWKLPAAAPAASADARSCSAGSVSPVHDGGTGAGRPQAKISYLVGLFGARRSPKGAALTLEIPVLRRFTGNYPNSVVNTPQTQAKFPGICALRTPNSLLQKQGLSSPLTGSGASACRDLTASRSERRRVIFRGRPRSALLKRDP